MSNAALAQDYFYVGPLLEERLREQIAEGIPVEGVEVMAQIRDDSDHRALVMFVMWGGDRFGEAVGTAQLAYQRWVVWVRARNASQADKDARNKAAGPLLSAITRAVVGWKPADCLRPFRRTNGPAPDYKPVSCLYPLAFEIQLPL